MARERVAGYITKQPSSDFGVEVKVQRMARNEMYIDGEARPNDFRNVIPPGEIGSEEGRDRMEPEPMSVDTIPYSDSDTRNPELHGSAASLRSGQVAPEFQSYATFEPRRAPMPKNASDSVFLPGYGKNVADPRMSDNNADTDFMLANGRPDRVDLYGKNRDGMAHNENAHPGFAAVQGKIEKEGYGKKAAGAILANATRHASKAAHKANPHLSRVKG